ncbi:MAG: hypothetical protein COA58_02220 [Bacteroidetes bacterium]|nr:MAG: hypothetical protein COA58_02220 [Bacteroidota bacterium]
MNNITAYIIYLFIASVTTVLVGKDLHKNGYYLILNLFDNESFTKTINSILLTGYYLINLGYAAITIPSFQQITNMELLLTELSTHIGSIFLILGALHFNNIIVLNLLSKRKQKIIQLFNN